MTAITASATESASALERERYIFRELFPRLRDALLNRIFDLRPQRAARRARNLFFLLILSGFVASLRVYSLDVWIHHVQSILSYLLIPGFVPEEGGNAVSNFGNFMVQLMSDPHIIQYIPIFLAPFFIAQQCAAIYLADIFELEDVGVARKFINEVALTGSDETIRITKGDVADEHRASPNFLIGGPGRVIVDLDSVALFERPDGTPHIIGPTGKEAGGKASIEGFERFRQAIDIRDHYVELRDQDDKSPSVKSRSLDGIPIIATDVRLMFSVNRDGKKPAAESPYPFHEKAIETMVYKATSRVTPDLQNPSTFEFSWINNLIGLIRGKLGGFMSERNLTVYLASIGQPEVEKAKQREEALAEQERQLASAAEEEASQKKSNKTVPEFTPRHEITNLFSQFAKEFTNSARERGVELHWIGVGTWKTPAEIVPEKHLEAWKLTRENLGKGSDEALGKFENEAKLLHTITLIQDVPVAAYQKVAKEDDLAKAIRSLLYDYRQQIASTRAFIQEKGEVVPPNIEQAITYIDSMMYHWAGSNPRQADDETRTSPSAESLYQELVRLVGGDQATADRLIEFEHKQFPNESREQLIERAINRLTRDRK